MDGMAFCPFRNKIMNAEKKNVHISHSGHSHSKIVNKKMCSKFPSSGIDLLDYKNFELSWVQIF